MVDLFTFLLDLTTSDLPPRGNYIDHHCALIPYPVTAYLRGYEPLDAKIKFTAKALIHALGSSRGRLVALQERAF